MSPLLFAMVDATLGAEVFVAERNVSNAAFMPLAHYTLTRGQMDDAIALLGWWRSTWGER